MMSVFTTAQRIAKRDLSDCVTELGFIAGTHHFVDIWARDCLFATFGANVSGLRGITKMTIDTLLSAQRPDGLVPFLIRRSKLTIGKYFGTHAYYESPHAQYRSSQSGGIVPDGGLLVIIAAREYAEVSQDTKTLRAWYPKLSASVSYYGKTFGTGLISEWFQCEWSDAVLKTGKTLYTNVLYWKALKDMAWIAKRLGDAAASRALDRRQREVGEKIRQELWTGAYFADWKRVFRHDYISSHANMLAIVFGLADRKQSASILAAVETYCGNSWTLETNWPRYPYWRIPLINYLTGTADYHNRGCLWMQPGILYAVALWKTGKRHAAKQVLSGIARKIVEYDRVFEVYEKTGKPVARLLYRSEGPFAWSAGLFLWARSKMTV